MKVKMEYTKAKRIADGILEELRPFCERIEIAGSIRRKKSEVGDIEIVAIPKPYETGLFENGLAAVVNRWEKVKGEMVFGKCKYTQRILPEGIKLDLFFAVPENWGYIFAIRTGSAEFSSRLAKTWVQKGYKGIDGMLTANGREVPVREEIDLFRLLGIPFVSPELRKS